MAQIIVSANIVIPNGPSVGINQSLTVDAYDKIDVVVPPGTSANPSTQVELQPGAAGKVQFIAIVSDWYGNGLTYKINDNSAANTTVRVLDQPQLFLGAGAVAMFDPAPSKLFFYNAITGGTTDAHVQILIGRKATS